jgi:hypothetical protein
MLTGVLVGVLPALSSVQRESTASLRCEPRHRGRRAAPPRPRRIGDCGSRRSRWRSPPEAVLLLRSFVSVTNVNPV